MESGHKVTQCSGCTVAVRLLLLPLPLLMRTLCSNRHTDPVTRSVPSQTGNSLYRDRLSSPRRSTGNTHSKQCWVTIIIILFVLGFFIMIKKNKTTQLSSRTTARPPGGSYRRRMKRSLYSRLRRGETRIPAALLNRW